ARRGGEDFDPDSAVDDGVAGLAGAAPLEDESEGADLSGQAAARRGRGRAVGGGKFPEAVEKARPATDDEDPVAAAGACRREEEVDGTRLLRAAGITLRGTGSQGRALLGERAAAAEGTPRQADELAEVHQRRGQAARWSGGDQPPGLRENGLAVLLLPGLPF